MKKKEFLEKLQASLWAMPETDKQRSVDYYAEMIDDRMEDGLSEEEAVAAIGDLDEIVKQILNESPRPPATVKKEHKQQRQEIDRDRLHDITDKTGSEGMLIGQLHRRHLLSFSGRL